MPIIKPAPRYDRMYTQLAAEKFVKYLTLWGWPNPPSMMHTRDGQEYRDALLNLIQVNQTRKDEVGAWETYAAEKELKALGGEK